MQIYVSFISDHWILLAIVWAIVVVLTKTRATMIWADLFCLDMILPGAVILAWACGVFIVNDPTVNRTAAVTAAVLSGAVLLLSIIRIVIRSLLLIIMSRKYA